MSQEQQITVTASTPTFGTYGKQFQEKIMQALLSDKRWAEQMTEVLDVSYFNLNYLHYLAEKYFSYSKKYKEFPTLQLLVTIIKDDLKNGTDILLRDQVIDYLQRVRLNPDPGDLPFVKEKSLDFCKKQALKVALEAAIDLASSEKYENIVDVIRKAVSVGTAPSLGHDFTEDLESRFVRIKRDCVPTGIVELDRRDILNGGLGRGELGVVCAATGVGKCSSSASRINVRYVGFEINGKLYKPWDKIKTLRGEIYARDAVESDELA